MNLQYDNIASGPITSVRALTRGGNGDDEEPDKWLPLVPTTAESMPAITKLATIRPRRVKECHYEGQKLIFFFLHQVNPQDCG